MNITLACLFLAGLYLLCECLSSISGIDMQITLELLIRVSQGLCKLTRRERRETEKEREESGRQQTCVGISYMEIVLLERVRSYL